MDKFNMTDMSVWQGRQDPEDGELALRWHDKVKAWPLSGTVPKKLARRRISMPVSTRASTSSCGVAGSPNCCTYWGLAQVISCQANRGRATRRWSLATSERIARSKPSRDKSR